VKIARKLRSPGVVTVYGVSMINTSLFIVLEYCEKGSLLSWLRGDEADAANFNDLVRLALGSSTALIALENNNYIHRDIAARNFLLTNDLRVKLSDFGMAKQVLGM
jgi:serine/threonine protein kinase